MSISASISPAAAICCIEADTGDVARARATLIEDSVRRALRTNTPPDRHRRGLDHRRPAQLRRPRPDPGRCRAAGHPRHHPALGLRRGARMGRLQPGQPRHAPPDPGRARQCDQPGDDRGARRHRPAHQRARHARADHPARGHQPHPGRGAGPAESRPAQGADRPHRASGVQAGRSLGHAAADPVGTRADRQPDLALCRRRARGAHRRPAPPDHHRRHDFGRPSGLRRRTAGRSSTSASTATARAASRG